MLGKIDEGEYLNRTGVHGFAIRPLPEQKQAGTVSKHTQTNEEPKGKVSKAEPDRATKNPGAAATATGAGIESEAAKLHGDDTPKAAIGATFYWDRGSGSVEPLRNFAGVAV